MVIQSIGNWHKHVVPSIVSSLAATKQQNRHAPRIKSIEDSIGATFMLDAQLSHVGVF